MRFSMNKGEWVRFCLVIVMGISGSWLIRLAPDMFGAHRPNPVLVTVLVAISVLVPLMVKWLNARHPLNRRPSDASE